MHDFNAVVGMLTTPLWAAAALLVLLLVLVGLALRRYGSSGSVAALFGVPALIVIAWAAWNFADHAIVRQRLNEREALNARALQLTTTAIAPGSPLACLDAGAGDIVEDACEAALFARPETVAAATAYTEARLRLLDDSLLYSWRADHAFSKALAQLRRTIEADRYGFVAHILVTRDGCTADVCDSFWLLREVNAVKENIRARTLETNIARHAASWGEPSPPAAARAPGQTPPAVATFSTAPVTRPIDFPSAASIPPVSIMTEPPPLAPAPPAATTQAPSSNRPAAPAASAR
jgi:hypothetical protein